MKRIFDQVKINAPNKSAFDLSREQKLSCKFGYLYPTYLQEILPGDQFRVRTESLVRFAPMLAPIMHRVDLYMHYFFVPNRIIWSQWEDFITGGEDGLAAPTMPQVTISDTNKDNFKKGTLADYLGVPIVEDDQTLTDTLSICNLPFRAYNLIWSEYYRDENLQDKYVPGTISYSLRQRAWEKDYFTSAFTQPQKGPQVTLPLQGNGTVEYKNIGLLYNSNGENPPYSSALESSSVGNPPALEIGGQAGNIHNIDQVTLDSAGITIEELRRSARLQEWLEKAQRGGTRYKELLLSYFGVRSSDSRLDRPEYLGGGRQAVTISEVLQTTQQFDSASQDTPAGTMYGHGITVGNTAAFQKTFEEHGFILGIMSVMPKPTYQQGLDRMWSRTDKFDFYWAEFANIGEQEIKNQELYVRYTNLPGGENTFGYQQRYAEYKYSQSSVHGDFRDTLSFWHLGRKFGGRPALTEEFITVREEQDNLRRIFAVQDGSDYIWCQLYHDVKARRPMPYFSNPNL